MNAVALRADTEPGNTPGTSGIYVVNGDWGGIGFYYNKNLSVRRVSPLPRRLEPAPSRLGTDRCALGLKARLRRCGGSHRTCTTGYRTFSRQNFLGLNRMSTIFKMPAPYAAAYQSYFYANDGDWLNPAKTRS